MDNQPNTALINSVLKEVYEEVGRIQSQPSFYPPYPTSWDEYFRDYSRELLHDLDSGIHDKSSLRKHVRAKIIEELKNRGCL